MTALLLLLLSLMAPATEPRSATAEALKHLRLAQSSLLANHRDEMMRELFLALRDSGGDPVIATRAYEFAKYYWRQEKPQKLYELPTGITGAWTTLIREQDVKGPLRFTIEFSFKTRRPKDVLHISVETPEGSRIPIYAPKGYAEVFPSKIPEHFTFRAWSAEYLHLPPGLYTFRMKIRGEEQREWPVLFLPDEDPRTLPSVNLAADGRNLLWRSPASASHLEGRQRVQWLALYETGGFTSESSSHSVWDTLIDESKVKSPFSGSVPYQKPRAGAYEMRYGSEEAYTIGDFDVLHSHVRHTPLNVSPPRQPTMAKPASDH